MTAPISPASQTSLQPAHSPIIAAPPILAYADLPARWGVSIIRDDRGLRIVVPPVPGWRQLHRGFFIGGAVLAAMAAFMMVSAISQRDPTLIPVACIYGGGFAAVFLVAFYRLHRRLVFDVTPTEVIMTVFSPLFSRNGRAWPRDKVNEIKRNPSSGKLLLRIRGQDFIEIYISPNAELTQWLGDILNQELAAPRPAVHVRHLAARRSMSPRTRKVIIAILCGVSLPGIILCFFGTVWTAIGMLMIFACSIPAGVLLGTQDKELFL